MSKPKYTLHAGPIQVSIWTQEKRIGNGSTVTSYSVTFQKSYRDEGGTWKTSNTFFQDDLPKLSLLATKAFEYITLNGQGSGSEQA